MENKPITFRFGISLEKPQSNVRFSGICVFYEPNDEIYLALAFMSYEIAIGKLRRK